MKEIEKIALEFCRENGIEVTLSYDMPAGYETAYGTYDVTINTLFLNTAILQNAPGHEVVFYLFHELRHAMQYLCPMKFDDKIKESILYVILYNGTCFKLVNNEWKECALSGNESYFISAYVSLPYEIDANTFAYEKVKEICGDSEELKKLFEFWTPKDTFDYEEYRKLFCRIDEKLIHRTRRAADIGDSDGQYELARYHEDGIGVERDMEQAIFWYRKAALQNHGLAIQKCKELGVDLNAPTIDREVIRKALQCRIYPLGYLERYKYTVICTSYDGKWILSRHKKRDTWETQGGHIEDGETPLECAKRELFEESGIRDADIYPVCDYWGFNSQACSNGMVFLAVVHSLGELPESEMKEIKIFDTLPAELTYPQTSPKLYAEAEKMLKTIE